MKRWIIIFLSFCMGGFMTCFFSEARYSDKIYAFAFTIFFCLVLFSIYLLKKKYKIIFLSIIIALVTILSFFAGTKIIEYRRDVTFRNADKIIKSLERYYSINNKYPEELSALYPKYIDKVPGTRVHWNDGANIIYSRIENNNNIYKLYFWIPSELYVHYYDNERKIWEEELSHLFIFY